MDGGSVSHEGVVKAVGDGYATVEILNRSACSACHARSACTAADLKVKTVEARFYGEAPSVGSKVTVLMEKRLAVKAVVISYAVPLAILLILLLSLLFLGVSEPLSALVSVAAAAVYFSVIYLMRHRLEGEFVFRIKL